MLPRGAVSGDDGTGLRIQRCDFRGKPLSRGAYRGEIVIGKA
jgi:hypothetical protein